MNDNLALLLGVIAAGIGGALPRGVVSFHAAFGG